MAKVIQASGEFATEGERLAAEELRKLPDTWTVLANKILPGASGRSHEIDFIVIGERLIFALDEKAWRGRIHGNTTLWVRDDGSSERSPLDKADYVAKILAGYLRQRVGGFDQIREHVVQGGVLLTRAAGRPAVQDPRGAAGIVLLADAVAHLRRRDAREGDPRVGTLRAAIEKALYDLTPRPKRPQAINEYEIVEATTGRGGAIIYRANHREAGPRLLTVYNLAGGDAAARDFYLQEFRALDQLRETGLVPECSDPFVWSDDFLVIPSHPPAGESLGALTRPGSEDAVRHEIERAAAAFGALARVHDAGVVHRAIGPEAVYLDERDDHRAVTFTGFFAARRGARTISAKLDELKLDDPYAAPEIAVTGNYGFASAESDVYSLALIFLERLAGVPVAALRGPNGGARIPPDDAGWSFVPQDAVAELSELFRQALAKGPFGAPGDAARPSAAECHERLRQLAHRLRGEQPVAVGDILDGRYRVERVLGVGATARTLLAVDTEADGIFALKQFLRPASIAETGAARREFNILRNNWHPHLPRVYDLYPATNQVHIKLEHIEGVPLSEALPQFQGQPERCRKLAGDLLGAIEHLEGHGLLHRDIKPENVILRDGTGEAVLIDFGAAAPAGSQLGVAGTPGYLPPEAYFADEPPPSSDRYALGVLLFRALTGRLPFADGGASIEQRPLADLSALPEEQQPLARVLLRAVAANPAERYPSAAALREALLRAEQMEPDEPDAPERDNAWVTQIRGLFRNSVRGNADNRGLDSEFARATYVPTALDERLLPAIFDRRPRAVFLRGNPGDGKTAFLERTQQAIKDRGGKQVSHDASGWEWRLGAHTFRACYDASEAHQGQSADEQLRARLAGLQGDGAPRADLTVLVAINDGRLADVLEKFAGDFGWLAGAVARAQAPDADLEAGGAWLVDLKRRASVALAPAAESRSVMRRSLAALLAPDRWQVCDDCAARQRCPIRRNALALGDEGAAARVEHLLLLAHLRGQRHVTMRDLRSGLAYLITGDLGCDDVHAARRGQAALPAGDFWQLAFTTDAERDLLLGELRPLDPARFAQPGLERYLYFHQTPADAARRAALFADGQDVPPLEDTGEWLARAKRRLVFHSRDGDPGDGETPVVAWTSLLPYRHADRFLAVLNGDCAPGEVLPAIARGIGRSDGLSGPVLDGGLCLKVVHSDANRLTVLKRFPLAELELTVARPPAAELVEAFPDRLLLRHHPSGARLTITLDLCELLLRLAEGAEPGGPELQPLLEDLAPFKSAVQLSNTRDLILVEAGRRLHLLTQEGGKVVRKPLAVGSAGR